ncbi:MAG: metal-dependent transcriptional regulator [Bacteroidetes bacterium]|nr:metal-dependent transcriptional regulator [Bacteroidota bacterium]MCZ2133709.1 metal-dependent transcriptional regulator [Bacteroidota bacterium]
MQSESVEDYLKVIYKLQQFNAASTNDIARALSVAPASVTGMIRRLADNGLVKYSPHKGVTLTEAGEKIALEIVRHHRLLELYLAEALGYSIDKVHDEAEKLEHHISEDFEERIAFVLGDPTHDPHGDPIPTKDGEIPEQFNRSLTESQEGEVLVIRRVSDENQELLRFLISLGLVPKTRIEVIARAPFNGPFTIKIGDRTEFVWKEVAERIFVSAIEQ